MKLRIEAGKNYFGSRCAHSDGAADGRGKRIGNVANSKNMIDICFTIAVDFYIALLVQINFTAQSICIRLDTDAD